MCVVGSAASPPSVALVLTPHLLQPLCTHGDPSTLYTSPLSPTIPSTSATRVITGAIPAQRQAPRGPENPHGEHGEDCWIVEVEDVSEGVVVEERER